MNTNNSITFAQWVVCIAAVITFVLTSYAGVWYNFGQFLGTYVVVPISKFFGLL